jgi:hypothetical protein
VREEAYEFRGEDKLVCHSDQLGQRSGVHLTHHLAAVLLHRRLAKSDLSRDLLVEAAGHDKRHHLTLTRAQRAEAGQNFGTGTLAVAARMVLLYRQLDRVQQVLMTDGFGQELNRTGLHGMMERAMNVLIGIAAFSSLLSLAAMFGLLIWVRVFGGKDTTTGQLALTFALATIGVLTMLEMGLLEVLRDGTMRADHAASQPLIALVVVFFSFLAGASWADYTLKTCLSPLIRSARRIP